MSGFEGRFEPTDRLSGDSKKPSKPGREQWRCPSHPDLTPGERFPSDGGGPYCLACEGRERASIWNAEAVKRGWNCPYCGRPSSECVDYVCTASEKGREQTWAANWYMTRRHIVDGDSLHALCSIYTTVWPDGWQSGASSHTVPPGDSPEVMALKPCGLCTRKVKR